MDSSVQAAVKATKTKKVAVLGTKGTINSGAYQKKLALEQIEVYPVACPMFVPLVENNYLTHEATYLIARDYLTPLKGKGVDTIILGCTHYPLLKTVISDIIGRRFDRFGAETISVAYRLLQSSGLLNEKGGKQEFFVSDSISDFTCLASLFLEKEINGNVSKIDIERF